MSIRSLTESGIGKLIMEALRKTGGSAGVTLDDIKQYLTSKQGNKPDMGSIKSWLNSAVDKGILSFSDGKYKLKDSAQKIGQAIGFSGTGSSDDEKKKPCNIC